MIRDIGAQRILNVDLSSGRIWREEVDRRDLLQFLGGRGINAKLLYERVPKGIDPLGPGNVLIFGPGTLTGTSAPSSGRTSVTCKGPATGLYLKVSVGGHLGAELKYSGHDYVAFHGQAEHPVYLWIDDEAVEIRDARHLWGLGTREADRLIREELGDNDIEVGLIGPAGENGVLFSCIIFSLYNSASRGGPGAVMGSKNLKALAIRGTGGFRLAEGEQFSELALQTREELSKDAGSESLFRWGTSGSVPALNELKMLASYNFSQVRIDDAEKLSGQYLEDEGYLTGRESCFSCSTACHRFVRSKEHPYGVVRDSGPELETMLSLGAECGIVDTEALIKSNQLCNDYGLDVISAGHVISWAMESYEKGLIKGRQADDLDLHFGNVESQLDLIRRIALREGLLGDLLANGTKHAAEEVGGDSWKWAIQAKGLEQSACDTRAAKSYALAFAVNPRGPDHLMTECYAEFGITEEARDLIRRITGDEKHADPKLLEHRSSIVRWHEDCYAATDALGFCAFTSTAAYAVNPKNMAQLFSYALGIPLSEEELMRAGRRIVTLERCFNVREGARREHDVLPWRMMNDPVPEGPTKGMVTDKVMLDGLLDEYYQMHGWDLGTGIPKRETIESLGLSGLCGDIAVD
ncbi:MAG: aldehyde ferredoxin oxidoreductase family protein [Anaerolineae bacterium]|nr:aldehyde ferredoxin oxidoreductase family protein [Anaerolineae bacterium]